MNIPERFNRASLVSGYDYEKFRAIRAKVIGCGATGNYVAQGLAGFGVDTISLIDPDLVEESNLGRQLVFTNADVGRNKAEALKDRVEERSMIGKINVEAYPDLVTGDNIDWLIPANETSIVFLCVDNIDARLIINDYCIKNRIPMINGGTAEGRFGEVCMIIPGKTACLRCWMKPDPERVRCSGIKNPSIVGNSMLVSSLMLLEFQKWMLCIETNGPILKYESGRRVPAVNVLDNDADVEMKLEEFYRIDINPRNDCDCQK